MPNKSKLLTDKSCLILTESCTSPAGQVTQAPTEGKMKPLKDCLELIGLPQDNSFTIKDAKRVFKKKSFSMLPEKALGNQNAHSKFEELNSSFVTVLKQKQEEGEVIDDIMPGTVDPSKVQIVINLRQGSVPFWKKVIRQMYPTVIIGAQKKSNFIPGGSGKAIRFVAY